jgi:hypothetical protein
MPDGTLWEARKLSLIKALTVSVVLLAGLTFRVSHPFIVFASASAAVEVVGTLKPDTGTLIVESNVPGTDLFINDQKHTMPPGAQVLAIALSPNTYFVRAARKGYTTSGPVQVSIARNAAMMLNVYLKPEIGFAVLKIQGAMPGTQVGVDGTPLGSLAEKKPFVHELSPGKHVIELSKQGFLSKRMERQVQAGHLLVLAGSEIQLASAPSPSALEEKDWDRVHSSNNRTDLEVFIRQYPASPRVKDATERIRQLRWENLDKKDIHSLQAFLSSFPDGPYSSQVRQALQSATEAKEIQAEQSDWEAVDKSSKTAVLAFLEKYPKGAHLGAALQMSADLDRKSKAAELARAEESAAILTLLRRYANAWSTKDLDSIVALQRNLDRRTVKEQLSPVRAIAMKISPVSPPQIEDARATVVCRRQVDEEFLGGVQKQSPELLVTFVLAKRNGTWAIESTR